MDYQSQVYQEQADELLNEDENAEKQEEAD